MQNINIQNKIILEPNLGVVELLDVFGNDSEIAKAARVSYSSNKSKTKFDDRALIRYLLRSDHGSPFEMVVFKFRIKCPIFVMRQIVRYRMASINEMSGRYSEFEESFYVPDKEQIGAQAKNNKQGRTEEPIENARDAERILEFNSKNTFKEYKYLLDDLNVAKEVARMTLPVNYHTEFIWQINLRSLFNFLEQRLDKHAQYETRQFAEAILTLVEPHVPDAVKAFKDYNLNAKKFSAAELTILRKLIKTGLSVLTNEEMKKLYEEADIPLNESLKISQFLAECGND